MSLVLTSVKNSIATITLNNYEKRNALSAQLIDDIITALETLRTPDIRVLILRAPKGRRVWSAGHDVNELPRSGRDPLTYNDPLRKVIRAIQEYPHPVIAMVEGGVWGGACEVVTTCDMVLAASNTTFAITPAKIGVPYNLSGVLNFMNCTSILLLKEALYTAQPISADRAAMMGLVNHVVPEAALEDFTRNIAEQIAQNSPLVVSILKEALRVLAESAPMNPEAFERLQSLRRAVYDSKDYQEGLNAFFERRKPVFTGC